VARLQQMRAVSLRLLSGEGRREIVKREKEPKAAYGHAKGGGRTLNTYDCQDFRAQGALTKDKQMATDDEDYVYDEASGEWVPTGNGAVAADEDDTVIVRDAVGNILADGDQVTLIKDLTVKGAGQTLKRGTLIKSIRLTGDAQEIDCRYDGIKGLVLRAEFVKKR
jgi:protein PhnA